MTLYERIKEELEGMSNADIIAVFNEYCDSANRPDDLIYEMREFDEIFSGDLPLDIVRRCHYGDFNPGHDYFKFNGYANLESFDIALEENSGIDLEELADYIETERNALNNSNIQDIIDEYEENIEDE